MNQSVIDSRQQKKILIFSDRYPPCGTGGASKIASNLAERYVKRGYNVRVISTVQERNETGQDEVRNVVVDRIYAPSIPRFRAYYSIYNPWTVGEVVDILDSFNPDVVHAHNVHEFLSYHTLAVASNRNVPTVLTCHDAMSVEYGKLTHFTRDQTVRETGEVPTDTYQLSAWKQLKENGHRYFPLRNKLNKYHINAHADVVVTVSNELRRALQANGIDCTHTVHNGVDVESFTRKGISSTKFRDRYNLGSKELVLFGGRISRAKGGEQIARAFGNTIGQVDSDVNLVVTGDRTSFIEQMKDLAREKRGRIVPLGWVDESEIYGAFRAASVVVTPSLYLDPFPTMNIEAMAAGTPVVTTTFGGGKEVVIHGETGFVCNPFNVNELSDALSQLLTDPALREEFGSTGRSRIREEFSLKSQVDHYHSIFDSI